MAASVRGRGRPTDPRNLQDQRPVKLPLEHDRFVIRMAHKRSVPASEIIRELVAAGIEATQEE